MTTTTQTLPKGHCTNNHGQSIHEDSKVFLRDEDRHLYGQARFVDALSFMAHYPDKLLTKSFTVGVYFYGGSATEVTDVEKANIANL